MTRPFSRAIAVATVALSLVPPPARAQTPSTVQTAASVLDVCITSLSGVLYAARDGRCFLSSHILRRLTDGAGAVRAGDAAGGDLSGTYPNPGVARLAGTPLDAATPSENAVLTYREGKWTPAVLPASSVTEQQLSTAIADLRAQTDASVAVASAAAQSGLTALEDRLNASLAAIDSRLDALEAVVGRLRAVSAAQPNVGDLLTWTGTEWAPHAPAAATTMRSPDGRVSVTVTDAGIELRTSPGTAVALTSEVVTVQGNSSVAVRSGNSLSMDAGGAMTIKGNTLLAEGTATAELKAGTQLKVTGGLVDITASSNANIRGAMVLVNGGGCGPVAHVNSQVTGQTTVSGPGVFPLASGKVVTGSATVLIGC